MWCVCVCAHTCPLTISALTLINLSEAGMKCFLQSPHSRDHIIVLLCVYVLQAMLGGSTLIHIFICQCFGSVQQFEGPSLFTVKFCEMMYIRWTSSQSSSFYLFFILYSCTEHAEFCVHCKVMPHFSSDEVGRCFHVIFW